MAYGLKYFSEFDDDQEVGYRVEVHQRDYSGGVIQVTSSGNPFVLEVMDIDNIYSPIRTKKATIEWIAEEDNLFEIQDLFIDDDQKYLLYLYRIDDDTNTNIRIFTGYLVTVDCQEPFQSKPYNVQLSAMCGLSFLRDPYFLGDGGEFIQAKVSLKDAIGQCLQSSGINLDFHTYVDIYDIQMGGGDPLALAEIAADGLRGIKCYDVLAGILTGLNAYVVQDNNVWVIKGVPDSAADICPRRIYDYQGVFKSSATVNQTVSIGRQPFSSTIPNLYPTANVVTKFAEISSIVKSTIEPGIAVNRLLNGQFAYPITGGNLYGWDINLNTLQQQSDNPLEPAGWQRTGFGTIDDPYKFEIRGGIYVYKDKPYKGNSEQNHIDISEPIIIDAGLFNKNQQVKIVISGAYRMRGVGGLYMECYTNDNEKDTISWLDESGKWNPEKKLKNRHGIKIEANVNPEPNLLTPANDLPVQTFEITSDPINDYLNRNGHAICKIYFRIFPSALYIEKDSERKDDQDRAPLLVLEDISIAVTTETVYEGNHTYVVNADLPIRNANEVTSTSIIADKINVITPEQVRLVNRVMTGYMTITNTENLTYLWKRRIGGNADPIDNQAYPIQFKTLKERLRQLCGKRIVFEGDFLGYDLQSSDTIFFQYDDQYDDSKFYTITGWKWDVMNRQYSLKLNELSLAKLSGDQEFVELDKEGGDGGRGNRLYGNYSGGNSSSGSGSSSTADPIELDPITPIYFIAGKQGLQIFDLGSYIISGHLPEELTTKIVYYPTWMNPIYEDRGVDGDILIYSANGKPLRKETDRIIIELTGVDEEKYLAVIPVIIEEAAESTTNLYDTSSGASVLLGKVPGFYFLPDKWNLTTTVKGTHDKVVLTVSGGGVDGSGITHTETYTFEEGITAATGTYDFYSDGGVITEVGVFIYTANAYRGTTLVSSEYGSFTLYDEEYLAKASNELYDSTKNELLGVIDIEGSNTFKKPASFDVETFITGLPHDKISFSLKKDNVEVFTTEYTQDEETEEAEYFLFNEIRTEFGVGKYDLLYDVSLLDNPVYQRVASFEILDEEVLPEAGIDLIEFKTNTINYSIVDSLPLFNYEADLPDNWGLQIPIPDVDYDFVEWKLYDSTTGGLAEIDVETYTNLPQYISYEDGEDKEPILVFELKDSTDIGDIHRAPSSFRIKAIFKLGGDSGKITGIRQADFGFRIPLEPGDYSGTRFLNITTGNIEIVDVNMPKTGRKYLLPEVPVRWSVSVRDFDGLLFDSVIVKLSKLIGNSYTTLHLFGANAITTWSSPGGVDVSQTPTDDAAYIFGFPGDDDLRYVYDPSNSNVIIDEIGSYRASFEFLKDSVSIGSKTTEFDLIDGTEPPKIPIKDCCGGGDATLPIYDGVAGTYGDEFKTLQVTTTENGTISAIEEIDIIIPGDEIVGLVHNFDVAPKILAPGTDLDNAATYGQVLTALASGSADKSPVKTVATANVSLSGLQTINGYTLTNGDRVLVTAQTNATENGCYVAASGAWARATDSDTGSELIGASYLVTQGSILTNQTKWKVVNAPPITIGSTNINIIQIQGAEIDPTVPLWVKAITQSQVTNWDIAYTASTNFNNLFDARFGIKTTNNLAEGNLNKYFTEDRVRNTVLTGYYSIEGSPVLATDNIVLAFMKLQGQVNAKATLNPGTVNYHTKYISATTIGNSILYEDGNKLNLGANDTNQKSFIIKNSTPYWNIEVSSPVLSYASENPAILVAHGGGSAPFNNYGKLLIFGRAADGTNGGISLHVGADRGAAIDIQNDKKITIVNQLTNTVLSSSPFNVSSQLLNVNLNADLLDGYHASSFVLNTALSGYVRIATSDNITAAHNFTGNGLSLPGNSFHSTFDGINVYEHYSPSSGNGLVNTFANLRVWSSNGTLKTLRFGGDGSISWDGINIVLYNRLINTGTGLLGGGDLSSNRTLSINFGTVAGTVSEGNHTHTFASLTAKPTTLVGYGITDAISSASVSGSTTYLSKFTAPNSLGNSIISEVDNKITIGALDSNSKTLKIGNSTDYYNFEIATAVQSYALTNPAILIAHGAGAAPFDKYGKLLFFARSGDGANGGIAFHTGSNRGLALDIAADKTISITNQLISSFSGMPLSVSSQVLNTNLNADLLDGQHGSYYLSRTNHTGVQAISTITGLQDALNLKADSSLLGNYVRKGIADVITAPHQFTSNSLKLPGQYYHSTYDGSNIYPHYSPEGGNGGTSTFANFRVWDAPNSTYKTLRFGGDGSFVWNGGNVALQSFVTGQGYITNAALNGYATQTFVTSQGYLTDASISYSYIINKLGFTPYNSTNPNGYITASSTNTLTNKSGNISQWANNVGYATEGYVNSRGFLTDSTVNFSYIVSKLGYTPYNASNPSGYISGINSANVTNALGYTPIPNNRTITINGNTQFLNDSPNFNFGVGSISGSGTNGNMTRWTGGTSIGNSRMQDTGSGNIIANTGIDASSMNITNNFTAGSGFITNTFSVGNLFARNTFSLPSSTEAALPSGVPGGTLHYVNTGTGKGLWCYMDGVGWRLMATRVWAQGGGAP